MQLNKNQVIEINLKDLFFHVLYRWRSILIAALIGAIALCGYQYISIKIMHNQDKLTKEERQYLLDKQKYQEDLESNQDIILINTKLLQGQNAYRKESIYFQLDSQQVWTASKKYLVKVDQSVLNGIPQGSTIDPADSILAAYSAPLSEATDDELKSTFGTDKPEYISELVKTLTDVADNTITVSIEGSSKEEVLAGLELLHAKMEELAVGKAQDIDKHTLSVVSESTSLGPDDDLAKKQEEVAETVIKLQEALQEARQTLNDLEIQEAPKEPGMHLIKMAILGFIIGGALLVFLYGVLYVFSGTLKNSRHFAERYKLLVFGELTTIGQPHTGKGLDKLFSRWEFGKEIISDEKVYDNIAALIAEKHETNKAILVSTLSGEKLVDIKEALTDRLPDKTISMYADINRNSDAINEASKADAVIIIEGKNVSQLKDMDRMVENLIIAEVNVIGAIIL